jgi:hypothetical protein
MSHHLVRDLPNGTIAVAPCGCVFEKISGVFGHTAKRSDGRQADGIYVKARIITDCGLLKADGLTSYAGYYGYCAQFTDEHPTIGAPVFGALEWVAYDPVLDVTS